MALLNTQTHEEFSKQVLESKKVVLVDFWAVWCPPCRMMAPILEKIAKSMDADVDVVKVNVEESQDNSLLAQNYGVQGIPNMQIFKNGVVVKELVGMMPEPVVVDELKKYI